MHKTNIVRLSITKHNKTERYRWRGNVMMQGVATVSDE